MSGNKIQLRTNSTMTTSVGHHRPSPTFPPIKNQTSIWQRKELLSKQTTRWLMLIVSTTSTTIQWLICCLQRGYPFSSCGLNPAFQSRFSVSSSKQLSSSLMQTFSGPEGFLRLTSSGQGASLTLTSVSTHSWNFGRLVSLPDKLRSCFIVNF